MKRVRAPAEPERFRAWREENPAATWAQFKDACRGPGGVANELFEALAGAQRGLCAYCEIELQPPLGAEVEHFYPKSKSTADHNWGLDFGNLLAGCEGGQRPRELPDRTGQPLKENLHCGASKKDLDLTAIILDPRQVPLTPSLWIVDDSGELTVDARACVAGGIDPERAAQTLARLGLNAPVLKRLRKAVRVRLKRDHAEAWDGTDDDELAAWHRVAEQTMPLIADRLPFWTTVRDQLGLAAERDLADHPPDW